MVLTLPLGTPPRRVGRRWKAIEFFTSECIPNPERRVSRCGHSELPCPRAGMNLAPENSPKCWEGLTGASLRPRNSTCRCPSAVNPATRAAGGVNRANLPAIRAPQNLAMQAMPAMALMAQPGHRRLHPNKSTYVTRAGGTSRWPPQLEVHFKGTEAVPTRRMNVANPRALRRALRRVAGFAKITKRVRRAVSMAASAVGVRHHGKKAVRRK